MLCLYCPRILLSSYGRTYLQVDKKNRLVDIKIRNEPSFPTVDVNRDFAPHRQYWRFVSSVFGTKKEKKVYLGLKRCPTSFWPRLLHGSPSLVLVEEAIRPQTMSDDVICVLKGTRSSHTQYCLLPVVYANNHRKNTEWVRVLSCMGSRHPSSRISIQ